MKSTDMFFSASSRGAPKPLVLSLKKHPEGGVLSPHVVSLWKEHALPPKQKKEKPQENPIPSLHSSGLFASRLLEEETDDAALWRKIMNSSVPSVEDQVQKTKDFQKEYSQLLKPASSGGFFRSFGRFW